MIYLDFYLYLCKLDNMQRDNMFLCFLCFIVSIFLVGCYIKYGRKFNNKRNDKDYKI